jgi:hypothetical protein
MLRLLDHSRPVSLSFARGVLIAAALLMAAMQFVPFSLLSMGGEPAEPLYKFWGEIGEGLWKGGVPKDMNDGLQWLVFIVIMAFHGFFLVTPWIAGLLQRARPLLWTARILISMVTGYFGFVFVQQVVFRDWGLEGEAALMGLMVAACLVGFHLKMPRAILRIVRLATLGLAGFFLWEGGPRHELDAGEMLLMGLLIVGCWVAYSTETPSSLLWSLRILAMLFFLWLPSEELLSLEFMLVAAVLLETVGLWLIPKRKVEIGGGEHLRNSS